MGTPESPQRDAILAEQRWRNLRARLGVAVLLAVVLAACYHAGLFDVKRLVQGWPSIVLMLREAWPPDFGRARQWVEPVFDTLMMSIAGTALAVALAVPLAVCAARTTTPHVLAYVLARGLLNALRAVPELILGILLVAAVGFGILPGVLALGLHSVGMVGKFFSEAIEHAHREPVEAARAVGAGPLQVILHGIVPQILPKLVDVVIYRWEYNFRASTVMGVVGAGGIGFELIAALRLLQYKEVSALLLVILVMVTLVDALGAVVRRRFK
jgi:phosphonate transport system permease protein